MMDDARPRSRWRPHRPYDDRERLLAAVASIEAVGQVPYDEPPVYSDDVLDLARLRRGAARGEVTTT